MNIIFLDIDGVLNYQQYFIDNYAKVLEFYRKNGKDINDVNLLVERQMMDIVPEKLNILKDIIDKTGAKVVLTSSWKKLAIYPYLVRKFASLGIPIVGFTQDNGDDRGTGIREYCQKNEISNYIILDDEVYDDYDEDLIHRLVKTSFYDNGIKNEHKDIIVKKLVKTL